MNLGRIIPLTLRLICGVYLWASQCDNGVWRSVVTAALSPPSPSPSAGPASVCYVCWGYWDLPFLWLFQLFVRREAVDSHLSMFYPLTLRPLLVISPPLSGCFSSMSSCASLCGTWGWGASSLSSQVNWDSLWCWIVTCNAGFGFMYRNERAYSNAPTFL